MDIRFDKEDKPVVKVTKTDVRHLKETLSMCERLTFHLKDDLAKQAAFVLPGIIDTYCPPEAPDA